MAAERDSERLLRRIVRDSPCGIAAIGLDRRFLIVNPVFCTQAGAEIAALPGVDGQSSLAADFLTALHQGLDILQAEASETTSFEWSHPHPGGACLVQYTVSLVREQAGAPVFYTVIGNDVTAARRREQEQRRLAAEFCNAEKLASLERMAGGIAHDFNNLLLGMIGQAELALMDLAFDHPAREAMGEIVKVGFRAADLCKQLLVYCGKGDLRLESLDLSTLVRDLGPLLEAQLGGLRSSLRLARDLPAFTGDVTQLRQVVLDLVANAAEAMRDRAGVIELTTSLVEHGPGALRDFITGRELPAGCYVRMEVRDDGCGMPAEQIARIFDPFYTTKPSGRGLGLPGVLGIVRSHHGSLAVASEVGRGTTVSIDLPAGDRVAAAGHPAEQVRDSHATPPRAAHIMVVDDEAPVRLVSARILEAAGYRVSTSADGYLALELFGTEPGTFDLVLLDMTMPGISGREALERIRQYRPNIPVLLTSGFDEGEVRDLLANDLACGFIQKPYTSLALQQRVAALLS
jgi:two-component system, cell cycle sensor histidine kinase and response regulator CckA